MTTKTTDKSAKSQQSPIAPRVSGKSAKPIRAQDTTTTKSHNH